MPSKPLMWTRLGIIIITTLFHLKAFASDSLEVKDSRIRPFVEVGVATGGQVSSGLFIYKTSKLAELGINFHSGAKARYGFGVGYDVFKNDHLVPVFFQFRGFTRKEKSCSYISIQAGYSFVSRNITYQHLSVKTNGGVFFCPGYGYRLHMKKHDVVLSVNYKHQFLNVRYNVLSEGVYRDEINLHMLTIKAGILFN